MLVLGVAYVLNRVCFRWWGALEDSYLIVEVERT